MSKSNKHQKLSYDDEYDYYEEELEYRNKKQKEKLRKEKLQKQRRLETPEDEW